MSSRRGFVRELIVIVGAFALLLTVLGGRLASASGTFVPTASMGTPRYVHTATLLADGRVLVAGGFDTAGMVVSSVEIYDPASGTFSPTGSMITPRYTHTMTLLADGRVLVAGGQDTTGTLVPSVEIYDPATGTFAPTSNLSELRRYVHTATLLADGRVLIAGGQTLYGFASSAELYDPVSDIFTPTGSMNTPLYFHTATLLADGRVLVAGGFDSNGISPSAELYDPATGTFSSTGSMTPRWYYHTLTLLADGSVLVVGGQGNGGTIAPVERYDPATGTFSSTGSMSTSRFAHTATLLADGSVLVAGGGGNGILSSAEVYDPSATDPDTTPPVIAHPNLLTVDATSPAGAVVTYDPPVSALDDVDGDVAVTCDPPSGSTFPVGSTQVNCEATDSSGNIGTGTFTVTVRVTPDGLYALIDSFVDNRGIANSLKVKLRNGALGAFRNEVAAQTGKALTAEEASLLLSLVGL